MPTALHIAGLPSQSPQRVGARLVRRLGGAVRSVIVRGITLVGTLRRPAASQTSADHPQAHDPQAPAPARLPVPPRPRPAVAALFLPPPLLAHLLAARRHHRPAATSRPAFLNQGDKPFTPEAFPQLSPKACAVLNTPLKDCDPKTLEPVLSTFASHINQLMSPEAGITDLQAALPNLWHRLNAVLGDTNADTSLPATPKPVPAAPAHAIPDAPLPPPQPPAQALPTGPATSSAKDAPCLPLSGPPASDPPTEAAIAAPASRTTPHITAPSAPVRHASPPLSTAGRSLRYHTQSSARCRPREFRCCRALFPRSLRDRLQCRPPPWRLYYAACIAPP